MVEKWVSYLIFRSLGGDRRVHVGGCSAINSLSAIDVLSRLNGVFSVFHKISAL